MFLVVLFQLSILYRTEEKCVNGHRIDREETRGDDVSSEDDQRQRYEIIMQFGNVLFRLSNSMCEEEESENADARSDANFAEKNQQITNFVDD